jgi:galactokinase
MKNNVAVSSPGRICLFGEHQDYLGLPVIAAAVNLRARLEAERINEPAFVIEKPDTGESETISIAEPIIYGRARDYFKSGVRVMQKRGMEFTNGWNITLTSGIPIAKGCSSSSAILVAWIGLLNVLGGGEPGALSPEEIAVRAFHAEVKEFNEPGGMMDHFSSACGGVLHIITRGEFQVHRLPPPVTGSFVLADSLQPKDTTGVLGRVKANVTAGINYLKDKDAGFDLDTAAPEKVEAMLGADVSDEVRRAVMGNIGNRDITRAALRMFNGGGAGGPELGRLLDAHHANLRDGINISTPKIEVLIAAAKSAGASGCKINGSGGGGCMIAYCEGDPRPVANAVNENGGKAYILKIDSGFRVETLA